MPHPALMGAEQQMVPQQAIPPLQQTPYMSYFFLSLITIQMKWTASMHPFSTHAEFREYSLNDEWTVATWNDIYHGSVENYHWDNFTGCGKYYKIQLSYYPLLIWLGEEKNGIIWQQYSWQHVDCTIHSIVKNCTHKCWVLQVSSIKYVRKYTNEDSDMEVYNIQQTNIDEITQLQTGPWISYIEAAWRTFGFPIHERYSSLEHLSLDLDDTESLIHAW